MKKQRLGFIVKMDFVRKFGKKARLTIFDARCPAVGFINHCGTGLLKWGFVYNQTDQKLIPSPGSVCSSAVDNIALTTVIANGGLVFHLNRNS